MDREIGIAARFFGYPLEGLGMDLRGWIAEALAEAAGRGLQAAGARGDLAAAAELHLLQDIVDVVLDRRDLDREVPGDLLVGQAALDQRHDLPFAGGQIIRSRRRL